MSTISWEVVTVCIPTQSSRAELVNNGSSLMQANLVTYSGEAYHIVVVGEDLTVVLGSGWCEGSRGSLVGWKREVRVWGEN